MPVSTIDTDKDHVGPYNRLSASQVNTWRECPRIWWYQNKLRLKFAQTPPLFLGRAVEECVTRVLLESPGLVAKNAPTTVMKGGADTLLPLYDDEIEKDLRVWYLSRVEAYWPDICEQMQKEWNSNPRKGGNWHDYSMQDYLDMCLTALEMHLEEVLTLQKSISNNELSDWRDGKTHDIRSPDRRIQSGPHPLAKTGECDIIEAWEIARPWFVDPDLEPFSQNAIHPGYWFQGEYDLVYRHSSKIKIVDLKASRGVGDRSGNYVEQLKMYAMLWSKTHDGQIPDSLEVWYLGVGKKKNIQVPDRTEINQIESDIEELWTSIKGKEVGINECPPSPSALRGFSEGGVQIDAPNQTRCETCEWSKLCPGGSGNDDYSQEESYLPNGEIKSYSLTQIEDLNPRISMHCEIFNITQNGENPPSIIIQKDGGNAFVKIISKQSQGQLTYDEGLEKGDMIRLVNVIPSTNWKGEIELKIDPHARLIKADSAEPEDIGLFDFKARWNFSGRVAYTTYKYGIGKSGKPWVRKGLVLLNKNSRVTVEGWDNSWPALYNTLQQGDELVILNVSLDAWAIDVKANIEKNSSIYRI